MMQRMKLATFNINGIKTRLPNVLHDMVTHARVQSSAHQGGLTAPMPGTVTVVKVAVGDEVAAGQSLLVVEAMKMEHVVAAPHAGTVTELDVAPGTTVAMDQVLAVIAPHEEVTE